MDSTRFIAAVFIVGALQSCSDTSCIYQDERLCNPDYDGEVAEGVVAFDRDLSSYSEKFLLEEFTGFLCTNCPDATATAKALKEQYQERLVLVGIHCTPFFAAPLPNAEPGEPFSQDFRTESGENYYNYFAPPGLPDGLINRRGTPNSSTISSALWADYLAQYMPVNSPDVYIGIDSVTVAVDSSSVKAWVVVKPLVPDEGRFLVNMGLMENNIHEAQKDVGGVTHYDYIHDHVFRGNSNGDWGTFAYDGDIELAADQALAFSFTIETEPSWVLANSDVFVYISREEDRSVVQVEERAVLE